MKRALCLLTGLLTLSLLPASAADEKTYPAKNPLFKFEVPAKWTSEVDSSDGSISITSEGDRISANFVEASVEASMEVFKEMVPAMVKELKDAKEVEPAKEQTEDGLTGYVTSYVGTSEGNVAMMQCILFKGGKDRSVIGTIVMMDPSTMPKEQMEKFVAFMKSLKGIAEK